MGDPLSSAVNLVKGVYFTIQTIRQTHATFKSNKVDADELLGTITQLELIIHKAQATVKDLNTLAPTLKKLEDFLKIVSTWLKKISNKNQIYLFIRASDVRDDMSEFAIKIRDFETMITAAIATELLVGQHQIIHELSAISTAGKKQSMAIRSLVLLAGDMGDELQQKLREGNFTVEQDDDDVKMIDKSHLMYGNLLHEGNAQIRVATYVDTADTSNAYAVAVKTFDASNKANDVKLIRKAVREATANQMENMVQVYGCVQDQGTISIVMELMEGTLAEFLTFRVYTWPEKIKMAKGIAAPLLFLANKNVLHRNLSSDVFLYDIHGTLKLSDFTNAKSAQEQMSAPKSGIAPRGTYAYIAPELISLKPKYSLKSEVYAFGVLLLEIATQKPPRAGMTSIEVFTKLRERHREEIPANVPHEFKELIEQCWHQDPQRRPTIQQCIDKLNLMTATWGQAPPPVALAPRHQPPVPAPPTPGAFRRP